MTEAFAESCWRAMKALKEVIEHPAAQPDHVEVSGTEFLNFTARNKLHDAHATLARAAIEASKPSREEE